LCGGFLWRISAADFCEFPADFRGGFSRRISAADFAADHRRILSISCGGFCGGFFSGPKPCKLHIKIAPKIHHKNPPHSSPHARLVWFTFFAAFFTACFAARPSTGILYYVTYTADFFCGGFLRGGFFAADFCAAGFLAADFCELCTHTALTFLHGCCAASGGHLSLHIRRDWGHMEDAGSSYPIGYAAMVVFQMSAHLASVLCHVSKISKKVHA